MKKLKVVAELLAVYRDSMDQHLTNAGDITRVKSIRPSQLPFCPINFFVRVATYGALRVMDMRGSFYTSVGTAVHETLQSYMGTSGRFLANWKCRQCGKFSKVSMRHECCDFQMDYHEISINYKGVVGHIDAVFRDAKGKFWILDFKTSSTKGIPRKMKNPGRVYKEQIETYALYLWLEHGIKVEGVMLMFVSRDNPTDPGVWAIELDDDDFKRIQKRTNKYKKMHKAVMKIETLAEALALAEYGKCKNPYCEACRSRIKVVDQLKAAFKRGKAANRLPIEALTK